MKKILCLLLAALMMLSICACGETNEGDENASKADGTSAEVNTADPDYVCDLPTDLDYKGDTVNIIFAKATGRDDELVSEGLGYGTISDAVYERNVAVEEQLKVTLNQIPEDGAVATKVDTDIKSGLGDYDIVVNGTYMAITPALTGKYLDLSKLENIDTSKRYWTLGYNDMVTFTEDNRQFLASGPIAISMFRLMFLTIYNKTLFEANQEQDLYDVVMNGEWTLDYQYGVLSEKYVDTDGDSKKSEGDTFGFVTGDTVSVDPYMVAADLHMIIKDTDTRDLIFNDEALAPLSDLVDKVQLIYNDASTYVYKSATYDDVGKTYITELFAESRALMATIMFWNMENNYNELGALSYGIAPIPKFSTEQQSYYSYVQDQVSSFGISAVVGDENRQEMLAAVLECMAYHSYQLVRPAYYDTSLSSRYMQDPQSKEILDLIFDSLNFDFSSSCSNILTGAVIRDNLRPILSGNTNRVASATKSWSKSVTRGLNKYNESLNALE